MYARGYTIEEIKRFGRWSSGAVHAYLWETHERQHDLSRAMTETQGTLTITGRTRAPPVSTMGPPEKGAVKRRSKAGHATRYCQVCWGILPDDIWRELDCGVYHRTAHVECLVRCSRARCWGVFCPGCQEGHRCQQAGGEGRAAQKPSTGSEATKEIRAQLVTLLLAAALAAWWWQG